jgi:hypothetical protein
MIVSRLSVVWEPYRAWELENMMTGKYNLMITGI